LLPCGGQYPLGPVASQEDDFLVDDSECVAFLQWALPRLGLRWAGFRKVRGQVRKRLRRRLRELELPDLGAYRAYLERCPEEWGELEGLTRITISRFHRDRGTFAALLSQVLPALAAGVTARGEDAVRAWSAGCASGEEPYTLAVAWQLSLAARFPGVRLHVLATDVDRAVLARARRGCYRAGSLRELPDQWRAAAFGQRDGEFCVRDAYREAVLIERHDLRRDPAPGGGFDLVLCRNLAFTYFDAAGQAAAAARLAGVLRPGGALVLGRHEALPAGADGFEDWSAAARIYRRR
jgi:chemotaxis protein methyltransferase CheR